MTLNQLKTAIADATKPFRVHLDNGVKLVVPTTDHFLFAPDGTVIVFPRAGRRHTLRPAHITSVEG